ncbi:MAG: response regulator [bacterium]
MDKPLILVVDDEKQVADVITQTITETNKYTALTAYSADEALAALKNNRILFGFGGNKIKLICLDIKMPGMDGLELLEKIRRDHGQDIGVLMLTAWEDEEKWERATSGFVLNYLKKPYKKDELLTTINKFFMGKEGELVLNTFEKHLEKKEEFKAKKAV